MTLQNECSGETGHKGLSWQAAVSRGLSWAQMGCAARHVGGSSMPLGRTGQASRLAVSLHPISATAFSSALMLVCV